jgi:ABC-type phosphate transport system substrate-binding protein
VTPAKSVPLLTVGVALFIANSTALADVVAVVSSSSTITTLSTNQLADIFMGRTTRFPNGELAVPIDQAEGSVARDRFYERVAGKTAAQMKAYWSKIIFTGRGQPPRAVSNSGDVKEALAKNPNAVGYIEQNLADASVRVLLTP